MAFKRQPNSSVLITRRVQCKLTVEWHVEDFARFATTHHDAIRISSFGGIEFCLEGGMALVCCRYQNCSQTSV